MSHKINKNRGQQSEIVSNRANQEESKSNSSNRYQSQYYLGNGVQNFDKKEKGINFFNTNQENEIPDYMIQQTQEDDENVFFTNILTPKQDEKSIQSDLRQSTQQTIKFQTPSDKNHHQQFNRFQSMKIPNSNMKEDSGLFFAQINSNTNQHSDNSLDEQKSTARKNLNEIFRANKDETPQSQKKICKSSKSEDLTQNILPLQRENYSKNDQTNHFINQNSQLQSLELKSQPISKTITITGKQIFGNTMKLSKVYPTLQYHKQASSVLSEGSNEEEKKWKFTKSLARLIRIKNKFRKLIQHRFSTLSQYERTLINDATDPDISLRKQQIQVKSLLSKILTYTFHPGSYPIIFFKACMLIITLYNIYFIPLIVGFDLEMQSSIGLLQSFSGFIFLIEILINFRTSYFVKGEIISDAKIIAQKYLNSNLLLDVISVIGCALGTFSKYFTLLTLIRINHLFTYMNDINNHFYLAERYHKTWTLTRLMAFIIFMAHYFACIFHFIALLHDSDPEYKTWVEAVKIQHLGWDVRYNYALYYSFITCITIGYGDITPQNSHERIACIVFAIFSSMTFSFSVNTIGNIFQDYFIRFQKQLMMRFNAIKFLSSRQIGKDLQLRVLKYIEYIHEIENESPEKGLSVINQISDDLKTEVFQEYYGEILKKNKHFALNYSQASIQKLALKVQEKVFAPGEILFEQGDQDGRLYYIIKGECEFYLKNQGGNKHSMQQTIFFSNDTEFFGYKGFISGIPREMSCRSKNISHVFYVCRNELINILKEDPLDYEQFCKIRDQFLLYTNSLGEECYGCKNFGHTLTQCPRIHLVRNRDLIALKYNFSANQVRKYQSRCLSKYSRLQNFKIIQSQALQFKKNLVIDMFKVSQNGQSVQEYIEELQKQPEANIQKYFPYIIFQQEGMLLRQDLSDYSTNNQESETGQSVASDNEQTNQKQIEEIQETNESQSDNSINQIYEQMNETKNNQNNLTQSIRRSQNQQFTKKLKKSGSSYLLSQQSNKQNLSNDRDFTEESEEDLTPIKKLRDKNKNYQEIKREIIQDKVSIKIEQSNKIQQQQIDDQFIQYDFDQEEFSNKNQLLFAYESKDNLENVETFPQKQHSPKSPSSTHNNSMQANLKDNQIQEFDIQKKIYQNDQNTQKLNLAKLQLKQPFKLQKSLMINAIFDNQFENKDLNDELLQRKIDRNGTNLNIKPTQYLNEANEGFTRRYSQQIQISKKAQQDLLIHNNKEFKRQSKFRQEAPSPMITRTNTRNSGKSIFNIYDNRASQSSMLKSIVTSKEQSNTQKGKNNDSYSLILQQILSSLQSLQGEQSSKKAKILKHEGSKDIDDSTSETYRLFSSLTENNVTLPDIQGSKKKQYQQFNYNKQTQIQLNPRNTQILMDLYIFDFDSLKEYQKYFPYNNASLICKGFNKYYQKIKPNPKKRSSKEYNQGQTKLNF